ELLVGGDELDTDIREEIDELAEPRREPVDADADRGRHLEVAVRALARVGKLGAGRLELHEHFVRGAIEKLALLREDQAARVAMKQRDRELLLECAHLARHGRLREAELLTRMGEAAGLSGGVKHFQLIPVHDAEPFTRLADASAVTRPPRAAPSRRVRRENAPPRAPPCIPCRPP